MAKILPGLDLYLDRNILLRTLDFICAMMMHTQELMYVVCVCTQHADNVYEGFQFLSEPCWIFRLLMALNKNFSQRIEVTL